MSLHMRPIGMLFPPRRTKHPAEQYTMTVAGSTVPLACSMKYLGMMFDSRWKSRRHVDYIVEKVNRIELVLSRLMSNLGGSKEDKSRFYETMVHSVLLYAVPV